MKRPSIAALALTSVIAAASQTNGQTAENTVADITVMVPKSAIDALCVEKNGKPARIITTDTDTIYKDGIKVCIQKTPEYISFTPVGLISKADLTKRMNTTMKVHANKEGYLGDGVIEVVSGQNIVKFYSRDTRVADIMPIMQQIIEINETENAKREYAGLLKTLFAMGVFGVMGGSLYVRGQRRRGSRLGGGNAISLGTINEQFADTMPDPDNMPFADTIIEDTNPKSVPLADGVSIKLPVEGENSIDIDGFNRALGAIASDIETETIARKGEQGVVSLQKYPKARHASS